MFGQSPVAQKGVSVTGSMLRGVYIVPLPQRLHVGLYSDTEQQVPNWSSFAVPPHTPLQSRTFPTQSHAPSGIDRHSHVLLAVNVKLASQLAQLSVGLTY